MSCSIRPFVFVTLFTGTASPGASHRRQAGQPRPPSPRRWPWSPLLMPGRPARRPDRDPRPELSFAAAGAGGHPAERQRHAEPGRRAESRGEGASGFVEMREVEIAFPRPPGAARARCPSRGRPIDSKSPPRGRWGRDLENRCERRDIQPDRRRAVPRRLQRAAHGGGVRRGGGGGDLWLQNNAGVIMHLKAASEGLMLSLGADVVDIRLSR